ncbi:MAG: putative transcriptional regulator [Kosmotogales bacterium]|nr:putative transcriptional regulator [Kosmotogales bacterium]
MSKLKKYRNLNKLTLKELSKKVHIPIGTLCNYETGYRNPDFNTADNLAHFFNIPVEELFPKFSRKSPYPKHIVEEDKKIDTREPLYPKAR